MEVSVLSWGYPQLIQSLDHDLVWKAMVTWGSPVFGKPPYNTRFRKPPYVTSPRYGENLWDDDLLTVSGQQAVSCSSMLSLSVNTCQLVWILPLFRYMTCLLIEGSLEVKLPTIWTDEKQSREEAERRERSEGKKMEMREKVGKSRNTVFFQWFVAPEGRKVGSLKRRVRSQLARWVMKNCTPLWREADFQVKM